MGGTGELGLYGYLGTFQSHPGHGHVDRELGLRRTYVPTYRLRFPCRGQVPKYHRHAFTNKVYIRENGRQAMR